MKQFTMRLLKYLAIGLTFITLILVSTVTLFMHLSPQFGTPATPEQIKAYELTRQYKDGKFINLDPFELNLDFQNVIVMLRKAMNAPDDVSPKTNIDVEAINYPELVEQPSSVSWLGHSTFIIHLDGKVILLDPLFGQTLGPHPWFGQRRFSKEMPITIEELPYIDVVIISHDHYDHLDYDSIQKLKEKTGHFLVPLGVGNHLRGWDIPNNKITELTWWQETRLSDQTFVLTPSQHMSGRRLNDQSSTLWGSWVIQGKTQSIYFSGDGGYGSHFATIGEKYGPFDIALMECGQYDELWPYVHLSPEETVQAGKDVNARLILPIHWGAFTLANHSWADPAVRVTKAAKVQGVAASTPKIGEPVFLTEPNYPKSRWWEKYL